GGRKSDIHEHRKKLYSSPEDKEQIRRRISQQSEMTHALSRKSQELRTAYTASSSSEATQKRFSTSSATSQNGRRLDRAIFGTAEHEEQRGQAKAKSSRIRSASSSDTSQAEIGQSSSRTKRRRSTITEDTSIPEEDAEGPMRTVRLKVHHNREDNTWEVRGTKDLDVQVVLEQDSESPSPVKKRRRSREQEATTRRSQVQDASQVTKPLPLRLVVPEGETQDVPAIRD
ncbi:unnamed protein product, partial [Amoebophrya sp. A25]